LPPCPFGRERFPALGGEDLLVVLVGELGVCDRELALEVVVPADFTQPPVGLGVDAGDEEARD
jgi:hypothetical protein